MINMFDHKRLIKKRFYRQHCTKYKMSFVKDLTKTGRELKDVVLVDVRERLSLGYVCLYEVATA